jgi:glycosyl transferase family 25
MLFLINLDEARERREAMQARLAALGLDCRRIGVDLRARTPDEIDAWLGVELPGIAFDHRSVSSAEIGCWASHLLAWRTLAASPQAGACTVLEDDLRLAPALPEAIAALCASPRHDLVFLGTSSRNVSSRRSESCGRFSLHRPIGTIYNTWGYVAARAWVLRFFEARPWRIDRPIDHYTGGGRARAHRPSTAVLRPAVVEEDPALGIASQIEPYTFRIDRARLVEQARRRILASRVSALYYRLYRFL